MLIVASAMLFAHFGSGLIEATVAPMRALPAVVALNVIVQVADAFGVSDATLSVTTPCHCVQPGLVDSTDNVGGCATTANTDLAVAGPLLWMVRVQLVDAPILTEVGHDRLIDRSARIEGGGGVVTLTVNGPAVALGLTPLDAVTV